LRIWDVETATQIAAFPVAGELKGCAAISNEAFVAIETFGTVYALELQGGAAFVGAPSDAASV
jgi:hypothetical protein